MLRENFERTWNYLRVYKMTTITTRRPLKLEMQSENSNVIKCLFLSKEIWLKNLNAIIFYQLSIVFFKNEEKNMAIRSKNNLFL